MQKRKRIHPSFCVNAPRGNKNHSDFGAAMDTPTHRKYHSEFIRIPEGESPSRTVFLFIHGIMGSPAHFNELYGAIPKNFYIHSMLLTGHGGSAAEFAKSGMTAWKREVNELLVKLEKEYESIVIVAHSMGALFALENAIKHEKIKGLVLLNTPLKVRIRRAAVRNALAVACSSHSAGSVSVQQAKMKCSVLPSRNPLVYLLWIPNFIALFHQISSVRRLIPRLNERAAELSVTAFHSRMDELVSEKAIKYLGGEHTLSGCPLIKVFELQKSTHFYYPNEDILKITEIIRDLTVS